MSILLLKHLENTISIQQVISPLLSRTTQDSHSIQVSSIGKMDKTVFTGNTIDLEIRLSIYLGPKGHPIPSVLGYE
jgi:hypothetical protein